MVPGAGLTCMAVQDGWGTMLSVTIHTANSAHGGLWDSPGFGTQ